MATGLMRMLIMRHRGREINVRAFSVGLVAVLLLNAIGCQSQERLVTEDDAIETLFGLLDADHDGQITSAELKLPANCCDVLVGSVRAKSRGLLLSTLYGIPHPHHLLSYEYYLEFKEQAVREQQFHRLSQQPVDAAEKRPGKFSQFVTWAIPVGFVDWVGKYRVVATTVRYLDVLEFSLHGEEAARFEFAEGRNFREVSDEHGYFEAVVGATVAREMKLNVGDKVELSHGDPEGFTYAHDHPFTVVGILRPSGTPHDASVFVNIEGFYLVEDHAKPLESTNGKARNVASSDRKEGKPLPLEQREVTVIMVKIRSPRSAFQLIDTINQGSEAKAILVRPWRGRSAQSQEKGVVLRFEC